jgi:predicted dehydrogenase
MYAILGSGFGLYGYLPALVRDGERIVLPERYRPRFLARPELAGFAGALEWAKDDMEALEHADGVVVAQRPDDQAEWITRCVDRRHVTHMLLEKPLASDPATAAKLFDSLRRSGKIYRIGYTFPYAAWANRLSGELTTSGTRRVSSSWTFLAYHFRHHARTWKRFNSQGGGAMRFYGIQWIAALAQMNYRDVEMSETYGPDSDEDTRWDAVFIGPELPAFTVSIDAKSPVDRFTISIERSDRTDGVLVSGADPFDQTGVELMADQDRRVGMLSQIYRSLSDKNYGWHGYYERVNALWREVEAKNRFKKLKPG